MFCFLVARCRCLVVGCICCLRFCCCVGAYFGVWFVGGCGVVSLIVGCFADKKVLLCADCYGGLLWPGDCGACVWWFIWFALVLCCG